MDGGQESDPACRAPAVPGAGPDGGTRSPAAPARVRRHSRPLFPVPRPPRLAEMAIGSAYDGHRFFVIDLWLQPTYHTSAETMT